MQKGALVLKNRDDRQYVPEFDPDPQLGLTHNQARQRIAAGWHNRVSGQNQPMTVRIVAAHCFTFFNLVFAVLAFVLVLVRSSVANFGFLGVVVINLAIGIIQQLRAKGAVEKLTLVAARARKVVRGGEYVQISDRELVRDDIVIFRAGEQICADGVVRTGQLQVNEALITGEPDLVVKQPGDELMSGSFVVAGKAAVQLIRVGDDGYAAKLAAQARKDSRAGKSEMMADLDRLIRILSILLVPLGVLYFLGEVAVPRPNHAQAAEQTVAALVSMIPQGLYLLTSIALAASAIKLSRQRVLVQDMNCIETLARVDVLCVDKTGTITQPGMQVEELIPLSAADPSWLEQVLGSLYSTEEPENDTARALAEMYRTDKPFAFRERIPFTSESKWSGAVFEEGSFVTGAPDAVMGSRYPELLHQVLPYSVKGYRVLLCVAYEGWLQVGKLDEERVTPLALILLKSRIRENAFDTFRYFAKQGVAVKVISGDDAVTAADAAGRAGIPGSENYVNCESLSTPEAYGEAAQKYTVFGRVTPEQKRLLIQALRKLGHTVAMTGDGVNDVLAMRQANCAVAMASGAQAACQVAQLVLLDSDFAALPHIVAEGRRVINNIQRAAALFLVKNIFTMALVLTALLTPLIYPFQPVTLTVITALTVGLPSFFFALEPNRERVRGRFLAGAMRKALPAGLGAFAGLVLVQLLPLSGIAVSTASALVLAVVGLLELWQVSRPLTVLRKGVLAAMGAALTGAFLLLGPVFAVDVFSLSTVLWGVLATALAATVMGAASLVLGRTEN